jgi:hypothetical protein
LKDLREDPNRDKMLKMLIEASDEETREMLITVGRPLVDYLFFQKLTAKIEAASDEEKDRLTALRKEILDVKERLDQEAEKLYRARAELLRDLLTSETPKELAQRRFMEIDEAFINILTNNIRMAEEEGNEQAAQDLRRIWNLIMELVGESLPPELVFFNQIMRAEDEEQIHQILQENKEFITPAMVEAVEDLEAEAREEGQTERADQIAKVLASMKEMV